MNINQFVRELCKAEGLTEQVNAAQMQEIVGAISDRCWRDMATMQLLVMNGMKRNKNLFHVKQGFRAPMTHSSKAKKKSKKSGK
jgi:hypothetical protein